MKIITTLFLFQMLFVIGCLQCQEKLSVIVEDQLEITPDTIVIRLNIPLNKIVGVDWIEGMNLLTRDSVIEIINQIEDVVIVEKELIATEMGLEKIVNIEYVEVYGNAAFKELKSRVLDHTVYSIEESKVSNLKGYKDQLLKTLILKSKKEARTLAEKEGQKPIGMISYKEISIAEKPKPNEIQADNNGAGGFGMLKEKFIEFSDEERFMREEGKVILSKKVEVVWEIE